MGWDDATSSEIERVDRDWGNEAVFSIPFPRRPLDAVFDPATAAGLFGERVVGPEVPDAFAGADPDRAGPFETEPPMIRCLRLRNPA